MNKLIFLDIDGVLNGYGPEYDYEHVVNGYPTSFGSTDHLISSKLVDNFNYLINYTKAKVVVSSVWRLGENVESMQKILDSVGVICEIVGLTESFSHEHSFRGNEIFHWIKKI